MVCRLYWMSGLGLKIRSRNNTLKKMIAAKVKRIIEQNKFRKKSEYYSIIQEINLIANKWVLKRRIN